MRVRGLVRIAAVSLAIASIGQGAEAQMIGSAHDFSVTGPARVGEESASRVCAFCHTPHNATPAAQRWSRGTQPSVIYTPYSSSTLAASPGQPTGTSKLCLSCHDGTIGLGSPNVPGAPITIGAGLPGRTNLTTDLSDDHPVSFVYDTSLAADDSALEFPEMLPREIRLDRNGELQCTSCHDAHWSPYPDFLVLDTQFSELCVACHNEPGWAGSSHEVSAAAWNGSGTDPWPESEFATVAANGCESCHDPHGAGSPERILREAAEEDNCLVCHNGNVASLDVATDLLKPSRHRVEVYRGVHDPLEDFLVMARHVECEDCHDPHAVTDALAAPPNASGALNLVPGVSLTGTPVEVAEFQYEVCFRCHGDSVNAPPPAFARLVDEPNLRLKLDLSNPSFHPVAGPGVAPDVPSLTGPYSETSVVYCTDCHASDSGPGAGGGGPAGPHGSIYPYILEREYRTADNTSESAAAYALCYKCHSRSSILGDQTFADHEEHISGENTPCSVCHDPHGVPSGGGAGDQTHLINFRLDVVEPDPTTGRLEFIDLGSRQGECYLLCHGKEHSPEGYGG